MKSSLQLRLDNDYELLRVAYIKKAESSHTPVFNLPTKSTTALRLTTLIPNAMQQASNWDSDWFSHYE